MTSKLYEFFLEMLKIGNKAVQKAQENNRKKDVKEQKHLIRSKQQI
jgi:hypothetical protein